MAYASIARNNQAISATCPYGRPRTRDIGAICSPCQLHIASADPSLSETGRNLECYPTNRRTLSPLRGSSRSMASALVHFTRPSTNKLLRWVVRKWDAHAHLSTRQTYHGVCYFHGELKSLGCPRSCCQTLQLNPFFATSILVETTYFAA